MRFKFGLKFLQHLAKPPCQVRAGSFTARAQTQFPLTRLILYFSTDRLLQVDLRCESPDGDCQPQGSFSRYQLTPDLLTVLTVGNFGTPLRNTCRITTSFQLVVQDVGVRLLCSTDSIPSMGSSVHLAHEQFGLSAGSSPIAAYHHVPARLEPCPVPDYTVTQRMKASRGYDRPY